MGWWSNDVLGGDDPLDILCDFAEVISLQESRAEGRIGLYPIAAWDDGFRALVRERIEAKMTEIVAVAERHEKSEFKSGLGYQVLAVVIMAAGAEFPDDLRKRARAAAMTDKWGDEDPARGAVMRNLLEMITRYDGTPSAAAHKSLSEAADDDYDDSQPRPR